MIEAGSVSCEITGSQSDKPWVRMASSGEREGEGGRRKEREGGRERERERASQRVHVHASLPRGSE